MSISSTRDTRADRNNFCRIKYKPQSDESGWGLLYLLLLFGKAQELVDSELFEFCCYYTFLGSVVRFCLNRFSGTKWPRLMVLFRENVLGGTKCHRQDCRQRPRHQYGQNSGIQVRSYRDSYFILYGWSSYRVKRLALRTHFCSSSLTYSLASWKEISPERYEASFSSASFL